ncbi:hypothetical protein [Actinokineospora sp. NPDC004072]
MPNSVNALRQRIRANAEHLAGPAGRVPECQDTASLIGPAIATIGRLVESLSDRAVKRDVVEVAWTR